MRFVGELGPTDGAGTGFPRDSGFARLVERLQSLLGKPLDKARLCRDFYAGIPTVTPMPRVSLSPAAPQSRVSLKNRIAF